MRQVFLLHNLATFCDWPNGAVVKCLLCDKFIDPGHILRVANVCFSCYDCFMLKPKQKTTIIGKHAIHEKDTGSPEVQAALFTEEIERLAKHLKKHTKDNSSRTGLLKMVAKRKRLLDYLAKQSPIRHAKVVKELGLKK